jgi:hypothetical protein
MAYQCTELRKVYPNGVPAGHPAYQSKMNRDHNNYECEVYSQICIYDTQISQPHIKR